jgi:hypothetical protein
MHWLHIPQGEPNIRIIRCRKVRWMAPVAGMGETEKCIQGFDDETLKEGDYFEDLDVGGKRVLKWILEEQNGMA